MPRIKRWFPVSHDINTDPEVWELTDKFGERALRVWLEMLSWSDRNEGLLKGRAEWWVQSLMRVYHCHNPRWFRRDSEALQRVLRWMSERHWIAFRSSSDGFLIDVREGSEDALVVLNHWKYHRTAEHKPAPSEPSEPSEPTKPSKKKNGAPLDATLAQLPEHLKIKQESWEEWLAHRKRKGAAVTPEVIKRLIALLERLQGSGHEPNEMLHTMIDHNWTWLREGWIARLNHNGNGRYQDEQEIPGMSIWQKKPTPPEPTVD